MHVCLCLQVQWVCPYVRVYMCMCIYLRVESIHYGFVYACASTLVYVCLCLYACECVCVRIVVSAYSVSSPVYLSRTAPVCLYASVHKGRCTAESTGCLWSTQCRWYWRQERRVREKRQQTAISDERSLKIEIKRIHYTRWSWWGGKKKRRWNSLMVVVVDVVVAVDHRLQNDSICMQTHADVFTDKYEILGR